MKVGDKVTLVKYPGWGVCSIRQIQPRGTEVVYVIKREESEGITLLIGVSAADITSLTEEQNDESR